jgi:hypothetical protein
MHHLSPAGNAQIEALAQLNTTIALYFLPLSDAARDVFEVV